MSWQLKLTAAIVLLAAFVAGVGGTATWSAFSARTSNADNTFSAAASFQALDHFDFDAVPADRHSGKSFVVTVRAEDAAGTTLPSYNGTVSFSVNSGSVAPATSNSFVNGVLTQAVTVTGPYTANQTITATGGSPSKTGTSNAFTLHDWKYYFTKATANTGTNCGTAYRKRDMTEGYAGSDPGETHTRAGGGTEIFNLCSPTFAAGDTLAAGTSTVSAYVNNTAGSGCGITATLFKNGSTSLGNVYRSIPAGTNSVTLFTWTINSSAATFAAGDRLVLQMKLDAVKACASTDIHYGGTTYRSHVQLPGPGNSAYSDAVLGTSGLASFWRLNEASGTTASDSKGTTNGTYTGGVTLGAAGALTNDSDKAAAFDGVDDFVAIGDVYEFGGTAPFSVELWFKKDVASTSDYIRLVDKHKSAAPRDGWVFAIDPGTQKILFERWGAGNQDSFASATATQTGRWYHLVGTYDGTSMRLYVDGALEATRTSSASMGDTTVPLRIARSADAASYFDGTIDDVAIYTSALSGSEVQSHYDAR